MILLHRRLFLRVQEEQSTLFDAHIVFMFSRQYHINCNSVKKYAQFNVHIISIFCCKYQINRHIFVFAFAPVRVYINAFVFAAEI